MSSGRACKNPELVDDMRFITGEEVARPAERALALRLAEAGDDPGRWEFGWVWETGSEPAGYAVVLTSDDGMRAFTVMPVVGRQITYDVVDVTDL